MPRPQRQRYVCREPDYIFFRPDGIPPPQDIILSVDEFEVIRLVDLEGKTHEETARQMKISRTTVTEIYESARYKISDSLVNGKKLMILGGNYRICGGKTEGCPNFNCEERICLKNGVEAPEKGKDIMRIAVTYENGNVFQHFGHTEAFKFYDTESGNVIAEEIVGVNGGGHGALADFLLANKVDVLICGGIGGGAQTAVVKSGIKLYGGVRGDADDAVKDFLEGKLSYDPDVCCNHHEHSGADHQCKDHICKDHKCHN